MTSIVEIVDAVEEELRRKPSIVKGRREKVAKLAELRVGWSRTGGLLRSREHAVFTTDQTRMMQMGRKVCLKLLVRGHHVADVELDDAVRWKMTARPEVASKLAQPTTSDLSWSHAPRDARAIREFIRSCADKLGKTPELQVQVQLVQLLKKKGKPAALENLQPVMPFGFPTEMPTVVNSAGTAATGNMDILARTVQGSRRAGGEFVVLELKKPNGLSKTSVAEAFEQAIRYAAALRFEADGAAAVNYRRLYGPQPPASRSPPNYENVPPLRAHAVVVLSSKCKDHATACLSSLGTHPAIGVGALLYRAEQIGNAWKLDETESAFEWVTHGWRP